MFNVNWKDYKEGLKGDIIRGFLGNRIRFKKEIKEGKNFCTHPQTVHPHARALGVVCGLFWWPCINY